MSWSVRALLGLLGLAVGVLGEVRQARDGWRVGRATYYGETHAGTDDGFSIHHGSCQFGRLDPDVGTGWDIAAIPDVHHEFQGSCGKCYEIACEGMQFGDNYGGKLDRMKACRDESKSVIVTIADVCPCNFPKNYYNNKRWCCGDMDHFDISSYAFKKLAPMSVGVIGLKYRPVPCPSYESVRPSRPTIEVDSWFGGGRTPVSAAGPVRGTVSQSTRERVEKAKAAAAAAREAAEARRSKEKTPTAAPKPVSKPVEKPAAELAPEPAPKPAEKESAKQKVTTKPPTSRVSRRSPFDDTPTDFTYPEAPSRPTVTIEIPKLIGSNLSSSPSSREKSKEATAARVAALREKAQRLQNQPDGSKPSKPAPEKKTGVEKPKKPATDSSRVSRVSSTDETSTSSATSTSGRTPSGGMEIPKIVSSKDDETVVSADPTLSTAQSVWDLESCSKPQNEIDVYNGGFHDCFSDGGLLKYTPLNTNGLDGNPAWCTQIGPLRSIAAVGLGNGMFDGKESLAFSIAVEEEQPDVSVALVGRKGPCAIVSIEDFNNETSEDGYQRFSLKLTAFAGSSGTGFEGCGSNTAEEIYAIAFRNNLDITQEICVDSVRLF